MSTMYEARSGNLKIRNCDKGSSIEEKLEALAVDLATNHCTVSFGEEDKKKVMLTDIFDTENDIYKILEGQLKGKQGEAKYVSDIVQHRNILVIGAGASFDSYSCIPLGKHVIDGFEERYSAKIEAFSAVKEKFQNHIKELTVQGRDPDFENTLSLYSELILTPYELRSEISNLFSYRYSPSLFYEIIAHLFKHSFIDVIINFNFDELLDQAIEEELGKDNYYHIISDGDCVDIEDMMIDGRLKIPIYIKPHGTVSHKSTLRFTKRHYLDVPEQIRKLLISLISGERGVIPGTPKENVSNIEQVNMICVGFNMESLEFGDIIDEHLPKASKFYHFSYSEKDNRDDFIISKIYPRFFNRACQYHTVEKMGEVDIQKIHDHIYARIAVQNFNRHLNEKNELTTPFAEIFSHLWRRVYYLFRKNLWPRSIARHEIVSYLFYDMEFALNGNRKNPVECRKLLSERYESGHEYFLDRTIVEIAIAINRNNGIIEISELLGGRAGLYYKKYRDSYFRKFKSDHKTLSIYDLIKDFLDKELRDIDNSFSKNILQIDANNLIKMKLDSDLLEKIFTNEPLVEKTIDPRMLKWVARPLNTSASVPDITPDYKALKALFREFVKLTGHDKIEENAVPLLVLIRLFRSKYLSRNFIENFQKNYNKIVFNGNSYEGDTNTTRISLVTELARLFWKSSKKHYYSIRPRYHDPKNYLSESFTRNNLLNTNLAVEYVFRNMFLNSDWDIALIISETGSILDFLAEAKEKEKLKGKEVIVLNSFDAIKQLHAEENSIRAINNKQDARYKNLFADSTGQPICTTYTFSLPAIQHNHHMMLFIKRCIPGQSIDERSHAIYKVPKVGSSDIPLFMMTDALYIYRHGFSNNLNPLVIDMQSYYNKEGYIDKLRQDFKKLIRIFATTFYKSIVFEGVRGIKGLDMDISKYQTWQPKQEREAINTFLTYLHNDQLSRFDFEDNSDINNIIQ